MTTAAILILYGMTGAGMLAMYSVFYVIGRRGNKR